MSQSRHTRQARVSLARFIHMPVYYLSLSPPLMAGWYCVGVPSGRAFRLSGFWYNSVESGVIKGGETAAGPEGQ